MAPMRLISPVMATTSTSSTMIRTRKAPDTFWMTATLFMTR